MGRANEMTDTDRIEILENKIRVLVEQRVFDARRIDRLEAVVKGMQHFLMHRDDPPKIDWRLDYLGRI